MQKDYWKMSEDKLTEFAEKYHIATHTKRENDEWGETYFDRNRIITTLVSRDAARRAGWTLAVAILALLVAVAAFAVSFATLRLKYNETQQPPPSQTVPTIQQGK